VRDVLFLYLLRFLHGECGINVVPRMLYVMGPRPDRFHALEFLAVRHLLGVPRRKTFPKITTDTHRVHSTTDDGAEDSPVARSGAYVCLRDQERRFLLIAYDDGSANRSEPLFLRGDRTNLPTDAETVIALLRSVPPDALHAEAGPLVSYLLDDRAGMQRTLDAIHASVNLDVRCALRAKLHSVAAAPGRLLRRGRQRRLHPHPLHPVAVRRRRSAVLSSRRTLFKRGQSRPRGPGGRGKRERERDIQMFNIEIFIMWFIFNVVIEIK
jgi:hypothetical protein